MRNKATLSLIEQVCMLLVFALAAVLCLRAFAWADITSKRSGEMDRALLEAQNAAETLKNCRGDFAAVGERYGGLWEEDSWVILYDEDWNQAEDMHTYTLRCTREEGEVPYLGTAVVEVLNGEETLACLGVAWQEVESRE